METTKPLVHIPLLAVVVMLERLVTGMLLLVIGLLLVVALRMLRLVLRELGWRPAETFETGMRKTVQWYLDHQDWVRQIQSGDYMQWIDRNYSQRTGAAE